jgi:hypothetical protein
MLSGADANLLAGLAVRLDKQRATADAQRLRDMVGRFDGCEGFTAIHVSAFALKAVEGEVPA